MSFLTELSDAYAEAEGKARESIDSQIGYFSELKKTSSDSAEKIVRNWEGQKEAFDRYASNLEKAVDMGLDETLVQQLSDGSTESMAILDEFVNGTDTSVDDINAAWQRMNESRQTVAQAMAAIETEVDNKLEEIVDDAKAAGPDTVKALANGIEGNTDYVTRAMRELANEAIAEYNRTITNGRYKTPSGASTSSRDAGISPYSVSPVSAQTMAVSAITPAADPGIALASTLSSATPLLASGTIVPPQAVASGASTFATASASTFAHTPHAIAALADDMVKSNVAGHEATVGVLSQILEAVLGIELDGEMLSKAVDHYRRKEAVCRGS